MPIRVQARTQQQHVIEITSTLRARTHLAATVAAPASAREGNTEKKYAKLQIRDLPIEKIHAPSFLQGRLPTRRQSACYCRLRTHVSYSSPRVVRRNLACLVDHARRTARSNKTKRKATRRGPLLDFLSVLSRAQRGGFRLGLAPLRPPATAGRPAGCVSPRGPSAPRTAPPTNAEQTFRELWTCGQAPSLRRTRRRGPSLLLPREI